MIHNDKLGKWLPHPPSGRGATWVEPTFIEPPRLWIKQAGAARALAWWLQGGTTTGQGHTWDDDTELVTTPKPERIAADWEVIPAQLILSQKTPKN